MSIFAELKRRNVFRVAALYLVAGWLLLQVADVLAGVLGLPDWTLRLVAFLLALGFPLALIFSWVFELTPEGVKRESEIDRDESITTHTGRRINVVIVVLLAVAIGFLAWDRIGGPRSSGKTETASVAEQGGVPEDRDTGQPAESSIAVLPFVNMSADAENEYFSDGLSEELLNLLAKVDGLKVAARTSSFKFRDSDADIGEIGRKLKVATVLEGSVRKAGNQVRITAQLIEVEDGYHLWSEIYDRELDNIFKVQEEIALAIVNAMRLPLLGRNENPITIPPTRNVEAYDLYLLGRHHARETTAEAFRQAIDYYRQAIGADPGFALAYSGLADAYLFLADYGDLPDGEAQKLAKTAVQKALEIDPGSSEANASLGLLITNEGRQSEAIAYFEKAIGLNPNYVNAYVWYGDTLRNIGLYRDALEITIKALELDPLSEFTKSRVVGGAISTGDWALAESTIQEMLDEDPDSPFPYEEYGNYWIARGQPDRAVAPLKRAHELRPGDTYMAWRLTLAYLQLDDLESARTWIEEARKRGPDSRWTSRARFDYLWVTGDLDGLLVHSRTRLASEPESAPLNTALGTTLLAMGDTEGAEQALRRALDLSGYDPDASLPANHDWTAALLAVALDSQDRSDERDRILGQLDSLAQTTREQETDGWSAAWISMATGAVRGDRDGALGALGRAIDSGFRNHWLVERNPLMAPYRDDPEFRALMDRLKQEAATMREGLAQRDTSASEAGETG